jgi:oxysterol-binding protein-related protein 9/10/11
LESLLSGAPYVELERSSYIVSSTGYTAKLEYTGRGYFSGKKNSFSAVLYRSDEPKKHLYTSEGQWTDVFVIKDSTKTVVESHDPSKLPPPLPTVAPIQDQQPLESRRAWQKVAEAIKKGDMDATQKEKSIIENEQRDLRKKEKEGDQPWVRKYFKRVDKDAVFDELAKLVGEAAEPEKTGGVWVWNGQKET